MPTASEISDTLLAPVLAKSASGRRKLIAIAGPPACGKTTIATVLAQRLSENGCSTTVVPMDGFHLDNDILVARGLLDRKGAPETFDVEGFLKMVSQLAWANSVSFPLFDRNLDCTIADAGNVGSGCDCVIVEGNYLLFDAPVWRELGQHWDISIRLDVPIPILRTRLIDRWLSYGLTAENAITRAEGNDLRNAKAVQMQALPADITLSIPQ